MTTDKVEILLLGIGNSVMGDDGVGVKIVCKLKERYIFHKTVKVVDGGTLGLDLLPMLENIQHLILVDAIESGKNPGEWVKLTGDELPIALETKLSPHQMGLKDLLAVSELMGHLPGTMTLFGIQPKLIDMDTELTPEVASAVEPVIEAILLELKSFGVTIKEL